MKKQLLIVFTSILLAATTTACGAGGSGETANKEKTKSKEGKTVVTLSLKEPNPFYQVVEKKFEEKNPDIDLQIQSYKKMDEGYGEGGFEKYIKTTSTALLSGKGADIFEVSDLPIDKYVDKKLLVNMNDLIEQDKTLNKSDLYMNILEPLKLNGGLYAMPSGFMLRTFVGDGDILEKTSAKVDDKNWTWKQFGEISKQLIQEAGKSSKDHRYALGNNPPELLLQEMVVDSYREFVDVTTRKAKFDSPIFEETLLQIKKMYDDKVMTSEPQEKENPLFYTGRLISPEDIIVPRMLYSNPKLLQKPHAEGQTGGAKIVAFSELAIQAKSTVKEEAWKFITFLLSEEVQSLKEREGLSLLKSVNEKKLKEFQEQLKSGEQKLPSGEAISVTDKDFADLNTIISTADSYGGADNKVRSIIDEESGAFFSGQKSAKEVAKLIQSRTTLYLNE